MTIIVPQTPGVVQKLHIGTENFHEVETRPVMVVGAHSFDRAAVPDMKRQVALYLAEHMPNAEEAKPGLFCIPAPEWSRFDSWAWGEFRELRGRLGAHAIHMNGYAKDRDKYDGVWMQPTTPDMADDFDALSFCWVVCRPDYVEFDVIEFITAAELTVATNEYLIGPVRIQFLAYYKNREGKAA